MIPRCPLTAQNNGTAGSYQVLLYIRLIRTYEASGLGAAKRASPPVREENHEVSWGEEGQTQAPPPLAHSVRPVKA